MLWPFDGETKLAVRNAPLATLHHLGVNRERFVEIEIPDIRPANAPEQARGTRRRPPVVGSLDSEGRPQ